jgi:hypothetical protein
VLLRNHFIMDSSPFISVPAEVRLMIYEYLFNDAGNKRIIIRSADADKAPKLQERVRSKYYVLDNSFNRRCYETTYQLKTEGIYFCPALMRANRKIYNETAHLVYAKHSFDFGSSIEAVKPFLSDLTPASRNLIQEISLYKRGPMPLYENDRCDWRSVCRFLKSVGAIKKLRLVIQGGKPAGSWDGPSEFSARDLKLLADIKHDSLDWVAELAQVEGIQELEVLPDLHYCPPPTSSNMLIFAAISASIERGLTEFLRTQMRLS